METIRRRGTSRFLTVIFLIMASLAAVLPINGAPAESLHGPAHPYGRYAIGTSTWRLIASRTASVRHNAARQLSRAGRAASRSINDGAQLELPDAAFPADLHLVKSERLDAAGLDNTVFAGLHTQTYSALGALGGWFQYYSTDLSDGLFDDVYLGSYYLSPGAASAAFTDVQGNLDAYGTGGTCSSGEQCYQIMTTITFPDGPYRGLLRVVRSSNALAEMIVDGPAADFSSLRSAQTADLDLLTAGFLAITNVTAPTPTSTARPSPTATPTNTSTPVPSPTVTPSPTSTSTPVPLSVRVRVARRSVKAGQRQMITVDTSPGASVTIVIVFPNGRPLHHLTTSGPSGVVTWRFKEPAHVSMGSSHTVSVGVSVQDAAGQTAHGTTHYSASGR
jgi:hypothetical protein